MKIIKTYSWNRRDFSYDAKCESCGHETKDNNGYDDSHYYNTVLPDKKCPSCQKSSNDLGTQKEAIHPKYNPNIIL